MAVNADNVDLGGAIVSNGRLEFRDNATISGHVVNEGTLNFGGSIWTCITVTGTLENYGTVVQLDPGVKFRAGNGGNISGVPESYIE